MKTNRDKVIAVRREMQEIFNLPLPRKFKLLPKTLDEALGDDERRLTTMVKTEEGEVERIYPPWPNVEQAKKDHAQFVKHFEGLIIIGGFGLGYIIEAILEATSSFTQIFVWERDPEVIRFALEVRDLTELLIHQRLVVTWGEDMKSLERTMYTAFQLSIPPVMHMLDVEWATIDPELGKKFSKEVELITTTYRSNATTVVAFAGALTENFIRNIPYLTKHPHISSLKDRAAGFPALIVGAGPSLGADFGRQIEDIKRMRQESRFLLIAVDTIMLLLVDYGISPDIVVSVDPQKETAVKYDFEFTGETVLVYHPGVYHKIPASFKGRAFHSGMELCVYQPYKEIFGEDVIAQHSIQCQGHLAVDVAHALGCQEITLVGFDLAYTYGQCYAKAPGYIDKDEEARLMAKTFEVEGIDGQKVRTTEQFLNYRNSFEQRAKKGLPLKNATSAGLVLDGLEETTLSEFASTFPQGRTLQFAKEAAWVSHIGNAKGSGEVTQKIYKALRYLNGAVAYTLKHLSTPANESRIKAAVQTQKVMKWATKREDLLKFFNLLAAYGSVIPPVVKKRRLPHLGDQLAGAQERAKTICYYTWVALISGQYLPMLEKAIVDLTSWKLREVKGDAGGGQAGDSILSPRLDGGLDKGVAGLSATDTSPVAQVPERPEGLALVEPPGLSEEQRDKEVDDHVTTQAGRKAKVKAKVKRVVPYTPPKRRRGN